MSLNVVNVIRKDVYFLQFSGYMQVEHNDASSTSVQTISANHAEVSQAMFFVFLVCSLILSLFINTLMPL